MEKIFTINIILESNKKGIVLFSGVKKIYKIWKALLDLNICNQTFRNKFFQENDFIEMPNASTNVDSSDERCHLSRYRHHYPINKFVIERHKISRTVTILAI